MFFGQSGRNLSVNWVRCEGSWQYFGANSGCFDHSLGVSVTWAPIYHPSSALIDCRFANFLWFLPIFLDFSEFFWIFKIIFLVNLTTVHYFFLLYVNRADLGLSGFLGWSYFWVNFENTTGTTFWGQSIFGSEWKYDRYRVFRISRFLGLSGNTTGTGISGFLDFGSEQKYDGYRDFRKFRFLRFWDFWEFWESSKNFQKRQLFTSARIFLVTMLTGRAVFLSYTGLKGK